MTGLGSVSGVVTAALKGQGKVRGAQIIVDGTPRNPYLGRWSPCQPRLEANGGPESLTVLTTHAVFRHLGAAPFRRCRQLG